MIAIFASLVVALVAIMHLAFLALVLLS